MFLGSCYWVLLREIEIRSTQPIRATPHRPDLLQSSGYRTDTLKSLDVEYVFTRIHFGL